MNLHPKAIENIKNNKPFYSATRVLVLLFKLKMTAQEDIEVEHVHAFIRRMAYLSLTRQIQFAVDNVKW